MTTPTVPPLQYSQVRMLAEAALGIPSGESATFTFDPAGTGGPRRVQRGAPAPDGVTVRASNRTRHPNPGQVLLQMETQSGTASLDAVHYGADAVFWSDSAVQKFVLPYHASCMGFGASAALAMLEEAWNGDFPGVQVCALMHVTGARASREGPGGLVEPLWVVYVEDDRMQARALADFASRYRSEPRPQAASPRVPYTAPALDQLEAASPCPDYPALRSMAEWAASLDTEPMYFTYDPERRQFGAPTAHAESGGGRIVVPVFNPCVKGSRRKRPRVTFGNCTLPEQCDAVFWSTGAIGQFLLPYYASIDGLDGVQDLQAVRTSWTENRPLMGGNLLDGDREVQFVGQKGGGVVTGVAHILLSGIESLGASSARAVHRELSTLHADASGAVTHALGLIAKAEAGAGAA
jgi:hypothetical protein